MKLNDIQPHILLELGDDIYNWQWTSNPSTLKAFKEGMHKKFAKGGIGHDHGEMIGSFKDGKDYIDVIFLYFIELDENEVTQCDIMWKRNRSMGDEPADTNQIRTIYTIMDIVKTFVTYIKPTEINFTADKKNIDSDVDIASKRNSRGQIYKNLVQKFANNAGYNFNIQYYDDYTVFDLTLKN